MIVILLLLPKGCSRSTTSTITSDTIYLAGKPDTMRIPYMVRDTIKVYINKQIASRDTVFLPIHVDYVGDTKSNKGWVYYYSGTIPSGEDSVNFSIAIKDNEITDIVLDICVSTTKVDSHLLDSIIIHTTDTILITKLETIFNKPKVTPVIGGALGYNHSLKLPSTSILAGIQDKRKRVWFIRGEVFSQSVELGVIIPLTTN